MVKVNLKNKFAFFNKSKTNFSNKNYFGLEEKINTSATWFQSMEPITYAKNNGNKLYKLKNIKVNNKETKEFRELLFNKLKKQLDLCKQKIKHEFLKTSDGSLNVGLNVILIDSMLIEILTNSHLHIFGNLEFKISIIAVGGYGRGELALIRFRFIVSYSNNLNKTEIKNIEVLFN